eukprot:1710435-Prymnesium_polylepis.1
MSTIGVNIAWQAACCVPIEIPRYSSSASRYYMSCSPKCYSTFEELKSDARAYPMISYAALQAAWKTHGSTNAISLCAYGGIRDSICVLAGNMRHLDQFEGLRDSDCITFDSHLECRNQRGFTMLLDAVAKGLWEKARWLLDKGADPNAQVQLRTPFGFCAGTTAMHLVCGTDGPMNTERQSLVDYLITKGANTHLPDSMNKTPFERMLEEEKQTNEFW